MSTADGGNKCSVTREAMRTVPVFKPFDTKSPDTVVRALARRHRERNGTATRTAVRSTSPSLFLTFPFLDDLLFSQVPLDQAPSARIFRQRWVERRSQYHVRSLS